MVGTKNMSNQELKMLPLKKAWWHRKFACDVYFITFSQDRIPRCPICNTPLDETTWTFSHGIAICICGTGFRMLHYDKDHSILVKEPECLLSPEQIIKYKSIWDELKIDTHSLSWGSTSEKKKLNKYLRRIK
jgi:hypothetical protein